MTAVTFPINIGGDGSTVSDDSNASTGLANGGHRTRFVPALGQVVAIASTLTSRIAQSQDTSVTSNVIGVGSKTFTTAKVYNWAVGSNVLIASTASPTNYMYGQVTAYTSSTGSLTVNVSMIAGSGTLAAWTISLSGPPNTIFKETKTAPSISTTTLTLDCSVGNVFAVSLNANITTLSFSNVPSSGTAYALTLSFIADGTARTVTWGAAVKWPGGTAPTLTSTLNKVDTFVLTTWDGGTTWYAFTAGQNA